MAKNKERFELIAKTLPGLEQVLADELVQLGAERTRLLRRAVSYYADTELLYRSNYQLYTALKILKPISTFPIRNENDLYLKSQRIQWSRYLTTEHTFSIEAVVHSSLFRHTGFVALKVKDAVADYFRDKTGRRPNVDTRHPDITIHVHITNQQCTLSLDSTGKSLHKRGYRRDNHDAPLNEVFAAGMLRLAGWTPQKNLFDPMCGSGTIVIEAGLVCEGIPPGSFRDTFAFENWLDYDPALFERVKRAKSASENMPIGEIVGSDVSGRYVSMAERNIDVAGLAGKITIRKNSFEQATPPWSEGMIVMNPPYGERMNPGEINALYRSIGDTLKKNFAGYEAWIISSNKDALKNLGLQTSKKLTLHNGPLEVKFQKYVLYKGSKKQR